MLPELRAAIIAECRRKVVSGGEITAVEMLVAEMADEAKVPLLDTEDHARCCGTAEPQYNCPETVRAE